MSFSTIHHKFLETFACAHVSDGYMEDEGDRMLSSFMKMQGSACVALGEVRELKDKGNGFYRQNEFDMAAACYDEACTLLSLSFGNYGNEDIQSLSHLAISLISNMAACALKLGEYKAASGMCSMILQFFPHNVKALFRRAVAYMKLKRFSLAKLDLVEALVVEPNNKDVLRELDVVKGHLLFKENGKRVLENAFEADMDGKNKKCNHNLGPDVGINDSESVITEVVEDQGVVDLKNIENVNMEDNESVNMGETEAHSICGGDLVTSLKTNTHISNKPFIEFSKKGVGSSRLRIPADYYKKLVEGKTVNFYRKHDLSTLTIRILKDEYNKKKDFIREQNKKKKRKKRRRPTKQKPKVIEDMNKDMTSLGTINVKAATSSVSLSASFPGVDWSSSASSSCDASVCDSFSSPYCGTPIAQDNIKEVVNGSSMLMSSTVCFPGRADSKIHEPFIFSACPKIRKFSSLEKPPCARFTPMFFRYSSTHRVCKNWKIATSKKNHSLWDESPRHNLSTFSKSRSLSRKFLRPCGVSVSCCRYSPKAQCLKAQLPRKRKEIAFSTSYSSNSLKKPRVLSPPTPSFNFCNNNVLVAPVLEMQVCVV